MSVSECEWETMEEGISNHAHRSCINKVGKLSGSYFARAEVKREQQWGPRIAPCPREIDELSLAFC